MKRAVFDGTHELKIVDGDIVKPNNDEVLIKVDSATICGTDIHILEGDYYAAPGVCLGHEFAGFVVETGKNVTACEVGDLVTVEPHKFCGVCKFCRIGKVQECLNKLAFGVHLNGGFEQYVTLPQNTVYKVPEGISPEEAALCEAVGCCLHGVEQVGVTAADKVVILGGGAIGVILMKICKLYGASSVIISEPVEMRRQTLLEKGADYVINPFKENLSEAVLKYTEGLGADVVIEAAGRAETAEQTFNLAGRCGRILFFGIAPPDKRISISPNEIYKKELRITGSAINPFVHYRVLQLLKQLDLGDIITHRFSLSKINEAINAAKRSIGLKICIKPNEE